MPADTAHRAVTKPREVSDLHSSPTATLPPMRSRTPMPHLKISLVNLLAVLVLLAGAPARSDELSDVQRLHYAGQTAAAMERAEQFLAIKPKDPQMRFLKGVMLSDNQLNAQAIVVFEKLSEDFPDLAEPYNNLAALHAAAGEFTKARATLEQALRTQPSYATAHENLGDVYVALANQSYQRALQLDPKNVTVAPKLALLRELYIRLGSPDSSRIRIPGASAAVSSAPPP